VKKKSNIKFPTDKEKNILKGMHKSHNAKKAKENKKCYLNNCAKNSISSHSFQKNGILSLLSDINNEVYSTYLPFVTFYEDPKDSYLFKTHINNTSIFKGFCNEHDTRLFNPIEEGITRNIEEYIFLNAFRGLAYTHIYEKEIRESNKQFSNKVIENPKFTEQTKELYKNFGQNEHLSNDIYKYENMKKKMLSVFTDDYIVDLEKLNKSFDIFYIKLDGQQEFLGTAATATFSKNSNYIICLGCLPRFKKYPNIFFVVTFKRDRSIDRFLKDINNLNAQKLEIRLKRVIQNTLVFTSSNIVLSKNKYFKMKKSNQLKPLIDFHIRSINGKVTDLFSDYNVELFD
jgi:hypothetical protein